jgi:homoserine O-acetyltransferase/O-succinyltransferase
MSPTTPSVARASVAERADANLRFAPVLREPAGFDIGRNVGHAQFTRPLRLKYAGARLVRLGCEWQGAVDSPVVLVAGGISAHHHLASSEVSPEPGWCEGLVGAGRALDPARYRLLAIDWLGADGGLDAPIDSADQADAFAEVLDTLGVTRLEAFVGYSYGAMVGLAFAARHGARLRRLVACSGAHAPHPYASAWRALQRRVVGLGRGAGGGDEALSLARQLAMLSYRTPEEFAERFAGPVALRDGAARCAAEDYLEACGARFVERANRTAFLRLSESIDLHRVDPSAVSVPTTVIAVEEDRLVPTRDLEALAAGVNGPCRLRVVSSRYGHDAFLKEPTVWDALLREALTADAVAAGAAGVAR